MCQNIKLIAVFQASSISPEINDTVHHCYLPLLIEVSPRKFEAERAKMTEEYGFDYSSLSFDEFCTDYPHNVIAICENLRIQDVDINQKHNELFGEQNTTKSYNTELMQLIPYDENIHVGVLHKLTQEQVSDFYSSKKVHPCCSKFMEFLDQEYSHSSITKYLADGTITFKINSNSGIAITHIDFSKFPDGINPNMTAVLSNHWDTYLVNNIKSVNSNLYRDPAVLNEFLKHIQDIESTNEL